MSRVPGSLARRDLLRAAVLVPATGAAVVTCAAVGARPWRSSPPALLSEGVIVEADGVVRALPPGRTADYVPGTRAAAAPQGAVAAAAQQRRDGARLPDGRWADLAEAALTDLLALTGPTLGAGEGKAPTDFPAGAVVAGPVGGWRYTWPRDASFAAAALSAVGLDDEALTVLEHLAALQGVDGGFEARYTAAGTVPDDRPAQLDGTGWVMWAAGRVLGAARPDADRPDADRPDADRVEGRLGVCLRRCASRLLELTDGPHRLPPVSPDYWEVAEGRLTLDTAMSVLLGLEAAARLVAAGLDLGAEGEATAARAVQVRAAIEGGFAPGWGRHRGDDDVDAAIALTAPPFTAALRGAVEVRRGARGAMARVSGGVGPGSSWRDDGVSWTPETALLAWSAAALGADGEAGLAAEADELLDWLVDRRTGVGALPEKVAADGSPAGPAPLAWTCSLLLLALCESDRGR